MKTEQVAIANLECATKAPNHAWAIVMYFYAAVHAVNRHAFGEKHVLDSFKHKERNQYVWTKLQSVDGHYRALSRLAHDARYRAELHPFTDGHVAKAKGHALSIFAGAGVTVPPS